MFLAGFSSLLKHFLLMHMLKHVVVMDILFVISIYIIFLIRNLKSGLVHIYAFEI